MKTPHALAGVHIERLHIAGGIVGVLFPGYFRWSLACGTVALICLLISRGRQSVAATTIIAAMLVITAIQAPPPSTSAAATVAI